MVAVHVRWTFDVAAVQARTVARVLLRKTAAAVLAVDAARVAVEHCCDRCGSHDHGVPVVLVDGERCVLHASVSHAGGAVAVVTAPAPVGIDLERLDAPAEGVDEVALTDAERRLLDTRPSSTRAGDVIRWWVRKEAVLKAAGFGLDVDPSTFAVSAPWHEPQLLVWSADAHHYALVDLDERVGFAATVALRGAPAARFEVLSASMAVAEVLAP